MSQLLLRLLKRKTSKRQNKDSFISPPPKKIASIQFLFKEVDCHKFNKIFRLNHNKHYFLASTKERIHGPTSNVPITKFDKNVYHIKELIIYLVLNISPLSHCLWLESVIPAKNIKPFIILEYQFQSRQRRKINKTIMHKKRNHVFVGRFAKVHFLPFSSK